ncbi:MAG: hypothetical protein JJE10_01565 [Thermoleophilia bacterium]|nr:hypothetical protein [Thermoleophilia bacterium]
MTTTTAGALERIALARLPELQLASGLFRASATVESVEETGPAPTTLQAGAVVLLGLLRADESGIPHPFSSGALRTRVLGDLGPDSTAGVLGLALWAESRAEGNAVGEITGLLGGEIAGRYDRLGLEQLSWVVTGLSEATVRTGAGEYSAPLLNESLGELLSRIGPGGAFLRESGTGHRNRPTPVASQFHALTALAQAVRAGRREEAGEGTDQLAGALVGLQREDGAWPGLVDPQHGEAAAIYPVLTVAQVALAPIAFRVAAEAGAGGDLQEAVDRGLEWAWGGNLLGFNLIHEKEERLDRGIVPRREAGPVSRGISTASRRLRGHPPEPQAESLILDPDVSSEDLGWVLEAWAGR